MNANQQSSENRPPLEKVAEFAKLPPEELHVTGSLPVEAPHPVLTPNNSGYYSELLDGVAGSDKE